ncbi:hypothetical protein BD413DRAFT_615166 [Trametes elegans]|nr:hypothetical protein BD413DRAFT_615166 [Trametes elegans]
MLEFKGPVRPADFERMATYARRVKVLNYGMPGQSSGLLPLRAWQFSVDLAACQQVFARFLGPRPLLPNLQTYVFDIDGDLFFRDYRPLSFLFGPRLRDMQIIDVEYGPDERKNYSALGSNQWRVREKGFADFFDRLGATKLEKLDVAKLPTSKPAWRALSRSLCSMKHLTEVTISYMPLNHAAVRHLALLPALRRLWLEIYSPFWADGDSTMGPLPSSTAPRATFPALQVLYIVSGTFTEATNVLKLVSSPKLVDVEMTVVGTTYDSEIRPLFATLATLPGRTSVEHLTVWAKAILTQDPGLHNQLGAMSFDEQEDALRPTDRFPLLDENEQLAPPPPAIPEDTYRLLFALSNLRTLRLDLHDRLDIDDRLLEASALAWPKIRELNLLGRPKLTSPWGRFHREYYLHTYDYADPDATEPGEGDEDLLGDDEAASLRARDAVLYWRRPRATLPGLLPLARHCPDLDTLAVPLDTALQSTVDDPSRPEGRPSRGAAPVSDLRRLQVGLSPIERPPAVAAFLFDVFPAIRWPIESAWEDAEKACESDSDEYSDGEDAPDVDEGTADRRRRCGVAARLHRQRWEEVQATYAHLVTVRQSERRLK